MTAIYAIVFAVVLLAMAAFFWWFNPSSPAVRQLVEFTPSNDLKRLLVEATSTGKEAPELFMRLCDAELLAVESPEASGQPMDFTMIFPAEFGQYSTDYPVAPDGRIQFGPYLVCFSSPAIVEGLRRHQFMAPLVTSMGNVRMFSARKIFESALNQNIEVVLNQFFGVTRRFSIDDIRKLLSCRTERHMD